MEKYFDTTAGFMLQSFDMKLPMLFTDRMKHILGNDFPAFEASFSDAPQKGVHLNCGRFSEEKLLSCASFVFTPISHIQNGYYYTLQDSSLKLGMHLLSHCGAVYSQDPSAMLPVSGLEISPNWRVLDLCASPGGKSSQIASKLFGENGFLISNEINPSRNKILINNIERMGYQNVIITKLSPAEIASCYPNYFHMVLVDAPCSGEGMFRKYPESIPEWSVDNVKLCQKRQMEILNYALQTLLPGGYLIYSTCTYSVEENEEIVRWLLREHHLEPVAIPKNIQAVTAPPIDVPSYCCRRAYPHLSRGEGQFMAYLKKPGELSEKAEDRFIRHTSVLRKISDKNRKLIDAALGDYFDLSGLSFFEHENKLIILPKNPIQLPPHGITLCGVTAGNIENNRFIPHHHFFHAYGQLCHNTLSLQENDPQLSRYLAGQELKTQDVSKGYGVICFEGCPIGGFKASNGRLKNHYPKALRNLS